VNIPSHYDGILIDGLNLSHILSYIATDMVTNIENNIKLNFVSYVKRFTNSSFKLNHEEQIKNAIYN